MNLNFTNAPTNRGDFFIWQTRKSPVTPWRRHSIVRCWIRQNIQTLRNAVYDKMFHCSGPSPKFGKCFCVWWPHVVTPDALYHQVRTDGFRAAHSWLEHPGQMIKPGMNWPNDAPRLIQECKMGHLMSLFEPHDSRVSYDQKVLDRMLLDFAHLNLLSFLSPGKWPEKKITVSLKLGAHLYICFSPVSLVGSCSCLPERNSENGKKGAWQR